jgi:hypothetical protein
MVGWSLHLYAIEPPASRNQTPVKEQQVLGHVAQSASTKSWSSRELWMGRPSRRISRALLLIFGGGTVGRDSLG